MLAVEEPLLQIGGERVPFKLTALLYMYVHVTVYISS